MPEIYSTDIILIIAAYLSGSICTAIILARLLGLPDPRTQGSGNPGATNMLRVGGKKAAFLTLVGDMIKGTIPVAVAQLMQLRQEVVFLVGFAAFIGHLYPIFFKFQGGKGVATAIGVLIAADWLIAAFTIGVWLGMSFLSKISSLSALTAFVLMPIFAGLIGRCSVISVAILSVMSLLLIWRHRSNIRMLLDGTET